MRESSDWISADQGVAMDFAGVLGMDRGPSRDESLSNAGACLRLRSTPVDFDSNLEPMTRCRANTWPCRPNDSVVDEENRSTPTSVDGDQSEGVGCRDPSLGGSGGVVGPGAGVGTRKAAARRNAWGNLSYADLITRAIESSPEKRLTLSQIYSWMVENVPFFKDKGDSNSSAGWKVSLTPFSSLPSGSLIGGSKPSVRTAPVSDGCFVDQILVMSATLRSCLPVLYVKGETALRLVRRCTAYA